MQVNQIRQKFLQFFVDKGHREVKSSSLVPVDDPTLLFTNAGMNQFKDIFLGIEKPNFLRATSSQKCVRVGGKHNDLENVGYTTRHHTFFEMLGNFSFGDYFKEDAIKYAWEFLTQTLQIPKDKLYVTTYYDDNEAYEIWQNIIGLENKRIIRIGNKANGLSDNFWQMGGTGPCGPCTEIFYDHGEHIAGGLPGSINEDGDRFVEIWNCVFMQFNRDSRGELTPLPNKAVDTGMGLERITAVMQNVASNYEIDLFITLIERTMELTNTQDRTKPSLKVIADHIRSISFLIADGIIPANEGRGYVLRRIIRRAIRHGYLLLGNSTPFLFKLVVSLVELMRGAYPQLITSQQQIERIIEQEEIKFLQTIDNGMKLLSLELKNVTNNILSGKVAFKLYDTFGFPLDLTEDICREQHFSVDIVAFDSEMQKQKDMARAIDKFKLTQKMEYNYDDTVFLGYEQDSINTKIIAIYKDNQLVDEIDTDSEAIIILQNSVFYAESGGQIGDVGSIESTNANFIIKNTQKLQGQIIGHFGSLIHGKLKVGDNVVAKHDITKRLAIARNHSVTHLLHKALQEVLGKEVQQKGSLVNDSYARFDFSYSKALTKDEIIAVENLINDKIIHNLPVTIESMSYDDAIELGAVALFNEKYTDTVRVIKMGDFSIELCGGTHVRNTGEIGLCIIKSEAGIASGIRRIEVITGKSALELVQKNNSNINELTNKLKLPNKDLIIDKINSLINENKQLQKQINELNFSVLKYKIDDYLTKIVTLANGYKLLILQIDNNEPKVIMDIINLLKDKIITGIIIIGSTYLSRANLTVAVTKDLTNKIKADIIVDYLATKFNGRGGGRATLAQASSNEISNLSQVLAIAREYVEKEGIL